MIIGVNESGIGIYKGKCKLRWNNGGGRRGGIKLGIVVKVELNGGGKGWGLRGILEK